MRRLGVAFSSIALLAVLISVATGPAAANGSPDVALVKTMPAETLFGTPTSVTLTASNSSGVNGFNLSFNDVLPPGVTFIPGTPAPTRTLTDPGGNTVIIWENVADLQAGTSFAVSYQFLAAAPAYAVGDTITNSAAAYANSDSRLVPDFDPVDGTATGDFTGWATTTRSTDLVPFLLEKAEGSTESELLRGVHTNKTTYTLTITNNLINATTGFRVEDYLPAGLEYLGCSAVDNSAGVTVEYPGSGRIDDTAHPPLLNCVDPTTVETITVDPDGPGSLPSGVYTHLVWTAADLGAQADLPAAGTLTLDYAAAVPLKRNVEFPPATATTGVQAANLDNNTGPLTTDEQPLENFATATGTYTGDATAYSDTDTEQAVAEDVSIHKSVDTNSIVQTGVSNWTLLVETGEYATNTTAITVTDTLPDGLCPVAPGTPCAGDGANPSPAATSIVENGDGTWTLVWNLADLPAPDSSATVTFATVAEAAYNLGNPVAAGDSWQNTVALTSSSDVITANDGSTSNLTIPDTSQAGQSAAGITLLKEVSLPAPGLVCGDGTGVTFHPAIGGPYRPGDRVCWRLTLAFPSLLDTLELNVTDYLPAGFSFESQQFGANHDATGFMFDALAPIPTWTAPSVDIGGMAFEAVVSSLIADPAAAADGDILANLMKATYENTAGAVFQLRDQADAIWEEPELTLEKGVILVDAISVPGAPADNVQVQDSSAVTYQVSVANGGSIDAEATSVRDILPAGITCADVGPISLGGACSIPDDWIQWDGVTVGAGVGVDLTYVVNMPTGIAAGAVFDNTAGVRSYQSTANTGTPFTYVPSSNIDTTLTPNTDPADDGSRVFVAAPTIAKAQATSIDEAGNSSATDATIGETIAYTATVTIPEGATVYGSAVFADDLGARTTYVPGTAAATLNGGPLPPGFSLTDIGNAVAVTFPASYSNPPLSGDDDLVVSFDATVNDVAANVRNSTITNTANFTWEDIAANDTTVSDAVGTRVVEPDLGVTKDHDDGDGTADPGQTIGYTLTVENLSGTAVSAAHEVVVVDVLPAQLTPLEAPGDPAEDGDAIPGSGGLWDLTTRTITWTVGDLDPGAAQALTYDAITDDPLLGSSTLLNTATATNSSMPGAVSGERDNASPQGGVGTGYQASDTASLIGPQLSITKSVTPATATVGDTVSYTLDVLIPAGVILYDASVVDQLDPGVLFDATVSATCDEGGGACSPDPAITPVGPSGSSMAWFLGDLTTAAVGDRTITIVYDAYLADVPAVTAGATLTNTAGAYGNQADTIVGIPANPPAPASFTIAAPTDSADVDVVEPLLTIDKDVTGQVGDTDTRRAVPGETLTFTLTITNSGTAPVYDVTVADSPDGRLLPISVVDGTGYVVTDADPADGTLAWTIAGPLAPTASVTVTYDLQVPATLTRLDEVGGPELTNTADVPHSFGIDPAAQLPGRTYRDYDNVVPDTVTIELDLASIGNRLWLDVDGDGAEDPGEPGLAGTDVTVTYLGPDLTFGTPDDEVFSATTATDGTYLVDHLPGGDYTVNVDPGTLPAGGLAPSYDFDDGVVGPDGAWVGTLGEAAAERDVDFGYTGTGSVGDTIWLDRNADGILDADEPGLGGVAITVTWLGFDVLDPGDDITYAATTAVDGSYLVGDLPAGEFAVAVDPGTLPNGTTQVFDPDATIDDSTILTLGAGIDYEDADFGYQGDGSIGDLVWLDLDSDGAADLGEPGIEGILVELTWFGIDGVSGGGDDALFRTTTDGSGGYLFDGLPRGLFVVDVLGGLPALVANTFDEDGDLDSSTPVSLGAGIDHASADFGYAGSTLIGDRVWWDINRDGVQDPAEPGLGGVEVTATYAGADDSFGTADDLAFTTTTNGSGDYLVELLPSGDFRIDVTAGIAPGFLISFDEDDGTTAPDASALVPGLGAGAHLTADFGYSGDGSLGDFVWFDRNGDGTQDADEPGLPGTAVELTWYGPDGVAGGTDNISLTTTTDASGGYRFDGLPAGNYSVSVDGGSMPIGLAPSSDPDPTPDGTTAVSLTVSEVRNDIDFGFVGSGEIGDTVWLDVDGDAAIGAGEPGLAGIDMTLWWAGADNLFSTADDATFLETTDSGGAYSFTGLPSGDYRVYADAADLPAGVIASHDEDGGFDSTALVALGNAESHSTADFGYRGSATVGDRVWIDLNGDGLQDPDEPGLPAVTVTVTSPGADGVLATGDDIVLTTMTDGDGRYQMPGLPSGTTEVAIDPATLPGGLVATGDLDGGDPTTTVVLLNPGDTVADVDYPLRGTSSLDGLVWEDNNGDGLVDAGESGLGGISVNVVWESPAGPIAMTVVTAADGTWIFESIPAGDYTATIDELTLPVDRYPSTPPVVAVTVPGGGSASVEHGVGPAVWIESTVWLDPQGDGIFGPDEPGIAGVSVTLLDGTGALVADTVTDDEGVYRFSDLPPGTYTIVIDPASLPDGVAPVGDPDFTLDLQTAVTVAAGGAVVSANFGFVAPAALPATGADLDEFLRLSLLLLAAGMALLAGVRRRMTDER